MTGSNREAGGVSDAGRRIMDLLMHQYGNADGLLAARVDVGKGVVLDARPLIDELGDYAQYACAFGIQADDPAYVHWGERQILRSMELAQSRDGLIYAVAPWSAKRNLRPRFYNLLALCDTVWGMVEVFRLTRNPAIKLHLDQFIQAIFPSWILEGFAVYGGFKAGKRVCRLPITNVMLTGYLAEALTLFYEETREPDYLKHAESLIRPWLIPDYVEKNGFFPLRLELSSPPVNSLLEILFRARKKAPAFQSAMVKGDAYLMFSLLAVHRVHPDEALRAALERWRMSLIRHMRSVDGRFHNFWDSRTRVASSIALQTNHSLIEFLLDYYFDMKAEEALTQAMECAGAWLKKRTALGLIPNEDRRDVALLDPQVDFCVNLLKLGQITGDHTWLDAADDLLGAVLRHHHLPFGFAWAAHAREGKPLHGQIETKYLGLFLKLLILHGEVLGGGKRIMEERGLRILATDR